MLELTRKEIEPQYTASLLPLDALIPVSPGYNPYYFVIWQYYGIAWQSRFYLN